VPTELADIHRGVANGCREVSLRFTGCQPHWDRRIRIPKGPADRFLQQALAAQRLTRADIRRYDSQRLVCGGPDLLGGRPDIEIVTEDQRLGTGQAGSSPALDASGS
jgi:hypothetical protein